VASKIAPAITYVAAPAFENCYDRTLPFLDRDFLEFMFPETCAAQKLRLASKFTDTMGNRQATV